MAVRGRGGGEGVRTRDHLASARTLQAWFRASLTLLAAGFAVEKLRLVCVRLRHDPALAALAPLGRWVAAGGLLVSVAALADFLRRRRDIEGAVFRPRPAANLALVALVGVAGVTVMVFLVAVR